VFIYVSLVIGFALVYFGLTNNVIIPVNTDTSHLSLVECGVLSLTAFHGRGFFFRQPLSLADPVSIATAIEGVFGLFVEAIFVAAFSRRFLGNN
jgi:hypothetical protein